MTMMLTGRIQEGASVSRHTSWVFCALHPLHTSRLHAPQLRAMGPLAGGAELDYK